MKTQIVDLLKEIGALSVLELTERLGISRQMIHRHLKQLVEDGMVAKIGRPPKVYYNFISEQKSTKMYLSLSDEVTNFIDEHFMQITEEGSLLTGVEAFSFWCGKRELPIEKTAKEYVLTKKRYLSYFKANNLIDGTSKLMNTNGFDQINLKQLFYSDFYAIERFGKTKLGQMLLYAKQGQNKTIIKSIVNMIRKTIEVLIINKKIDAVGFIPPSIKREVQFMKELERYLELSVPLISIEKVKTNIIVPQKTLSKLTDRIANARNTIVVTERRSFNKVLLIDDAVGSGATINETAEKVLKRKVAKTVYGYAVTGSFKGFDVISEA